MLPEAERLSIYIHWPYCESKCPYCDFNSYAQRSIGEEQYLQAALRELSHYGASTVGRPVASIFFGGGSPSLMNPRTVGTLLDAIADHWVVEGDCEITLEANPSSVEASRFAGYRSAGVNRVSLGVQSLYDEQLRFLGRLHSAEEARNALAIAARHFDRVSFDLIYARPGQTEAEWRGELSAALDIAQGHLSLYQLTIEPETAFFDLERRGKLKVPGAELGASLYHATQDLCERQGMPAYEISNHAVPGQESLHNLNYWRYGDYIGVGPGAHGRLKVSGEKTATAALKSPLSWYEQVMERGQGCEESCILSTEEQAEEMVLMGLRLREGLDTEGLRKKTGFCISAQALAALLDEDLLVTSGSQVAASPQGRLVLNAIVTHLTNALEPAF